MNKHVKIIFIAILFQFINLGIHAQALTGIKTINAQGSGVNNYTSLKSAIDSLNKYRVGIGGVTFNISANHVEQAPKGGYLLHSGMNFSERPITFQKSGIGNNPVFIAYKGDKTFSSRQPDGIFNIAGIDNLHLKELSFVENSNNISNTELMEYGIGIFLLDTNDRSHNITITKCKIELSKNNVSNYNSNDYIKGSTGIIVLSKSYEDIRAYNYKTYADVNMKFTENEISNVNTGIEVDGYFNKLEIKNNKIYNFGNNIFSAITSYGIIIKNTRNYILRNNEISSSFVNSNIVFSENKKSVGIQLLNESGLKSNDIVENNYIKIISSNNVNHLVGIEVNNLDTLTILKNTVDSLSINTNDTSSIIAIDIQKSNTVKIDSNLIQNQIYYTPVNGIADIFNIRMIECSNAHVINNNIKFTKTKNKLYNRKLYANLYIIACDKVNIESNDIEVLKTSTQDIYLYYTIHTLDNGDVKISKNKIHSLNTDKYYSINSSVIYSKDFSSTISNNILENIYSYRDISLINCEQLTDKITAVINNNIIRNVTSNNGSLHAIRTYKHNVRIYNNRIYNINLIDNGSLQVIRIDANYKVKFFNNSISNINANYNSNIGANPFLVSGIYVRSANIKNSLIEIYNNSIQLQVSNTSFNILTACVYHENEDKVNSEEELLLSNNIFINYSGVSANNQNSSANIIMARSNTRLYSINKLSNNNIYYLGTAKIRRYFYRDLTNAYLNFATYKAFANPRETKSANNTVNFIDPLIAELRINDSSISYAESNGKFINDNEFDINGKKRPGYTYSKNNSGYGMDIGAFEFDGIDTNKVDNKSPIVLLDKNTLVIDACNDSTHLFKLSVFDQSKINSVKLHWKEDTSSIYNSNNFIKTNDSSYEVNLYLSLNNIDYYFEVIDSLNNKTTSEIYKFNKMKVDYNYLNNEVYLRLGDTLKHTIISDAISTLGSSKDAYIEYNHFYTSSSHNGGGSFSYLYSKDELKAAGLNKGYINSMMFKIFNQAKGNNLVIDWFSISIARTFSDIVEIDSNYNFQTVFETTSYWPKAGENTHSFNTPFYWDGVSNIIVKICERSDKNDSYSWESEFVKAKEFTSIRNYHAFQSFNVCDYNQIAEYINSKPLIYLQNNLIPTFVNWYSNDTNSNILIANQLELIAKPLTNGKHTYIRESIFNNCKKIDTLNVYVSLFDQLNLEDTLYVCENDLKELDAKNKGSNYWWYVNNQFISNNQKIYANTTGNYIVVIRDNLNNTYIDSSYLIAYDVQEVNLGADTQICIWGVHELNSNVLAQKYLWSTGDTTSSTKVLYATNNVKLKAFYKNGCSSEDEINVIYDGIVGLNPFYFYYPDTAFKYFSANQNDEGFVIYEWNMDDPQSTENIKFGRVIKHKFITNKNQFNIRVKAHKPGYICEYTDSLVFLLVNVDEIKSEFSINIHPNPVENTTVLNYKLIENENIVSIKIYDLLGREIKTIIQNTSQAAGDYQYNLAELEELDKGVYILSMSINNQIYSQKLLNN